MAVQIMARLRGVREARRTFQNLNRRINARRDPDKIIENAFVETADVIGDEIRARTPVDTGALRSQVYTSVAERDGEVSLAAGFAVPEHELPKALAVEYGNSKNAPRAPIRGAFESKRDEVVQNFGESVRDSMVRFLRRRGVRNAR